jgi:MarC family integral membrane protein
MSALSIPAKLTRAHCGHCLMLGLAMVMLAAVTSPALAQAEAASSLSQPNVSVRKIFIMLFLMLGPIKILVPFINLTRNEDPVLRRRLATRAMLFSLAALALAGLLDRNILENFEISVPVLEIALGLHIITHSLSLIGVFVERTY